jgi:hypothetical protein
MILVTSPGFILRWVVEVLSFIMKFSEDSSKFVLLSEINVQGFLTTQPTWNIIDQKWLCLELCLHWSSASLQLIHTIQTVYSHWMSKKIVNTTTFSYCFQPKLWYKLCFDIMILSHFLMTSVLTFKPLSFIFFDCSSNKFMHDTG